jgi:hypothetical protein
VVKGARSPRPQAFSPEVGRLRRRVRFAPNLSVLCFAGSQPPCSVGRCLGHSRSFVPGDRPNLISIIKTKPSPSEGTKPFAAMPSVRLLLPHVHLHLSSCASITSEWLKMTPLHAPGNWYEGDSGGVKGQQNLERSAVPGRKRGVENSRCSNCLAKDHRAAHCREPKRCWNCKALGHLSFNCKAARISSSQLCCAPSPAPCRQNHFFPSIPPSETTMERRRSIGGRSDCRASPPPREEGRYPREREQCNQLSEEPKVQTESGFQDVGRLKGHG